MSAGEPLTSKPTGPLPNLGQAEAGEGGRCKRVGDIRCGGCWGSWPAEAADKPRYKSEGACRCLLSSLSTSTTLGLT